MFNSRVPAANSPSPDAPCAARESVESGADAAHVDNRLCALALSDDPHALASKLDRLIRQARSREISSDQLIRQLMQTESAEQTALHKGFHPNRLGQLNALLDHLETALQEGLLQSDQLMALLLKQDMNGQSALQLFADSARPGAENLQRLCDCVLRLLQRKLLSPADASDILLQRGAHGGAFDLPMVRGSGTDDSQPDALRVLFDFATRLVEAGAVRATEVTASMDPAMVDLMVKHGPAQAIAAFDKGKQALLAATARSPGTRSGSDFSATR